MATYHVGCGFADIYAGILNKKGDMWRQKSDVTKECLAASAQYLLQNNLYYGFELKGQKYRLEVIKEESKAAGVGDRIRKRLEELGMSQHDLAMASGVDDKKIRNYAIGYTVPKVLTGMKIAEALECSVEWLLGVESEATE